MEDKEKVECSPYRGLAEALQCQVESLQAELEAEKLKNEALEEELEELCEEPGLAIVPSDDLYAQIEARTEMVQEEKDKNYIKIFEKILYDLLALEKKLRDAVRNHEIITLFEYCVDVDDKKEISVKIYFSGCKKKFFANTGSVYPVEIQKNWFEMLIWGDGSGQSIYTIARKLASLGLDSDELKMQIDKSLKKFFA